MLCNVCVVIQTRTLHLLKIIDASLNRLYHLSQIEFSVDKRTMLSPLLGPWAWCQFLSYLHQVTMTIQMAYRRLKSGLKSSNALSLDILCVYAEEVAKWMIAHFGYPGSCVTWASIAFSTVLHLDFIHKSEIVGSTLEYHLGSCTVCTQKFCNSETLDWASTSTAVIAKRPNMQSQHNKIEQADNKLPWLNSSWIRNHLFCLLSSFSRYLVAVQLAQHCKHRFDQNIDIVHLLCLRHCQPPPHYLDPHATIQVQLKSRDILNLGLTFPFKECENHYIWVRSLSTNYLILQVFTQRYTFIILRVMRQTDILWWSIGSSAGGKVLQSNMSSCFTQNNFHASFLGPNGIESSQAQ